jgi:hypothetical protein
LTVHQSRWLFKVGETPNLRPMTDKSKWLFDSMEDFREEKVYLDFLGNQFSTDIVVRYLKEGVPERGPYID